MLLELTADELLSTTRAVRKRLDLTRPVEREVLEDCLGLAQQAPTASYSQKYHTVFADGFIKSFTAPEADLDHNGRISMWEAFTFARRPIRRRLPELPPFVTTRGGEYCFAPGLRGLRWLAGLES